MKRFALAVGLLLVLLAPPASAAPTQIDGSQVNRVWKIGTITQTGLNIISTGSSPTFPAFKVYHPNGGLSFELKVNGNLSTTGAVLINPTGKGGSGVTVDVGLALEVIGTASGRVLHAQNALTSSGSLRIAGVMTGATAIYGAGLGDCDGATTSKLLWDSTTGRFSCGTDTDTDTNTTYQAGQGLGLSSTVFTLNPTISGSLIRFTTVSGSTVFARNQLESSGSLVVNGPATFKNSSFRLLEAGFANCSALETVSGVLTCGSDAGSSYIAGRGLSLSVANAFTLNTTITGSLVRFATVSGSVLYAKTSLASSGTLAVESTGTFEGNLTTRGGLSGSRLYVASGPSYMNGPVTVSGSFTARKARICRNYSQTFCDSITGCTTGSGGVPPFRVPPDGDRYSLSGATVFATTAGSSGLSSIQVKNVTQGNYIFSSPMAIGSGRTQSGVYALSTSPYRINKDDVLIPWVSAVAGTAPKGFTISINFCP